MAFSLGKFAAGVGSAAADIGRNEQQGQRDMRMEEMRAQIMAAKQEKLASLPTTKQRELESMAETIVGTKNPETDKPYTLEEARQQVTLRAAGMTAKEGTYTGAERTAITPGLADAVANSEGTIEQSKSKGKEIGKTEGMEESDRGGLEGTIAAEKEKGKAEVQLEMLPKIKSAVKKAEADAVAKGESLSEYRRAQAALPGIQEVVGKLKTLSDVSTYTMAGRAFDTVAKELGFGATKGSTARAKMESLVDNQILPLLKDTFGTQFTESEGEKLRKTMLDIDAAPEQKKAILDSFLEQKMRNLETKEREIGTEGANAQSQLDSDDDEYTSLKKKLGI